MILKKTFDLAIIGAGPGGYVAAIKGAQMGKKVALIEKEHLGGTCLNIGCIPSKSLLSSANVFNKIKHAEDFGINIEKVSFDYRKIKRRKDIIVKKIRGNLAGLLKTNGIETFQGFAQFESPKDLKVKGKDNVLIHADKIIIATGSQPIDIPAFPCDHERILNSTSALELTELPETMAIIGGGYIGCEFASLFSEFGVKVTIIEALSAIVQAQGKTISDTLTSTFIKRGIEIKTNTAVEKIDKSENGLVLHFTNGKSLNVDKTIVSVGRSLDLQGLCPEKAGLNPNSKGAIEVNKKMETHVPGIYAIGDITAISMLAHVASHQGLVAAANACDQESHLHYNAIPAVIFTRPEIATVGITAEEAIENGLDINIGTFPFQALGKSVASNETNGFVQVISDKKTGEIYGSQVVGHEASTMIAEMALAINNELTLDCIIDTIHAHPTISEAWLEASLLAHETPIHFPPKTRPRK